MIARPPLGAGRAGLRRPLRPARRLGLGLVALAGAALLAGCLDEPEIEDRWTRVDMDHTNLIVGQTLAAGSVQPIQVNASITYRAIVTGFAVAELRASATVPPGSVDLRPNAPRERMAYTIDHLLQNSVSVGRATRAVTGWDHLIQQIDFNFTGWVPATIDSAGIPIGAPVGLYLLTYLGSGEEVELPSGADSIIVTPFPSAQYQILPVGLELGITPPIAAGATP